MKNPDFLRILPRDLKDQRYLDRDIAALVGEVMEAGRLAQFVFTIFSGCKERSRIAGFPALARDVNREKAVRSRQLIALLILAGRIRAQQGASANRRNGFSA